MDQRRTYLVDEDRQAASPPAGLLHDGNSVAPSEIRALRETHEELLRVLATHDVLAQLALDGAGLTRIAEEISRRVGNPVIVENRFLELLTSADPSEHRVTLPPLRSTAELLADANIREHWQYLQTERRPIRLSLPGDREVGVSRIIAPVVIADETVGYVTIIGQDHPLGNQSWLIAREAALAIGIEFVRQGVELDTQLRSATDFLEAVLAGTDSPPEIQGVRSSWLAFDVHAPAGLLMLALDPAPAVDVSPSVTAPTPRDVVKTIAPWARQRFHGSLVGLKDDRVVLVTAGFRDQRSAGPSPDPGVARTGQRRARRTLEWRLDPKTAGLVGEIRDLLRRSFPGLSVSVAAAPPVDDWRELRRTYGMTQRALTALELLGERGKTISTVDPRLAIFLLLDGAKSDSLREFVDLVLGPLLAYDTRRGRSLLATLEAFLGHGGQIETTARALEIHASTLKYRLQRISDVGGLDLRNADHRFNAALALRLRALAPNWE